MAKEVGRLFVLLGLEKSDFVRKIEEVNGDIKRAEREWKASFGSISREFHRLTPIFAGFGGAIVAPLALALNTTVRSYQEVINELRKIEDLQNKGKYREALVARKEFQKHGYTAAEIDNMRTTVEQFEQLQQSVQQLAITVGTALLPVFQAFATAVTPIIQSVSNWIIANPQLATTLLQVAGILGIVSLGLASLGALMPAISAGFTVFAGVAGAFGVGMLPMIATIGLVIAGLAALALIIKAVSDNWDALTGKIGADNAQLTDYARSVPVTPRFALGGIVNRPTLAMVGEAGPEAIIPLGGSGGVGGDTYIVNVAGSIRSDQEISDIVRMAFLKIKDRNRTIGLL